LSVNLIRWCIMWLVITTQCDVKLQCIVNATFSLVLCFISFITCCKFTRQSSRCGAQVGLVFGLTYAAMIYCMRHVGEAHLNPIVTVAMLLTRRASVIKCLLFIVAQFLGAIIGAGLAVAVTAPQLRIGTISA